LELLGGSKLSAGSIDFFASGITQGGWDSSFF
jgi:hypothetical protein